MAIDRLCPRAGPFDLGAAKSLIINERTSLIRRLRKLVPTCAEVHPTPAQSTRWKRSQIWHCAAVRRSVSGGCAGVSANAPSHNDNLVRHSAPQSPPYLKVWTLRPPIGRRPTVIAGSLWTPRFGDDERAELPWRRTLRDTRCSVRALVVNRGSALPAAAFDAERVMSEACEVACTDRERRRSGSEAGGGGREAIAGQVSDKRPANATAIEMGGTCFGCLMISNKPWPECG
jgi:hypothetical protein